MNSPERRIWAFALVFIQGLNFVVIGMSRPAPKIIGINVDPVALDRQVRGAIQDAVVVARNTATAVLEAGLKRFKTEIASMQATTPVRVTFPTVSGMAVTLKGSTTYSLDDATTSTAIEASPGEFEARISIDGVDEVLVVSGFAASGSRMDIRVASRKPPQRAKQKSSRQVMRTVSSEEEEEEED